jgi:hypothetical protein
MTRSLLKVKMHYRDVSDISVRHFPGKRGRYCRYNQCQSKGSKSRAATQLTIGFAELRRPVSGQRQYWILPYLCQYPR